MTHTTALNIVLCIPDYYPSRLVDLLYQSLPNTQIARWPQQHPKADYALVWSPSQAFIDANPQVKAIFNLGAGVDGVLKLNVAQHIPLVRLEDCGMAAQMADFVSHAVLRHARGLGRFDADAKTGLWKPRKALNRDDFPVGVMGVGLLGKAVINQLHNLGFRVQGWSKSAHYIEGVRTFAGDAQFDAFLAASRILVNLLPLTPSTAGILNATTFAKLQTPGYVINVARGAHLVEADLIPAIDAGVLEGAALDVFTTEPLPANHAFWAHPAITVTPHISAQTLPEQSFAQIAHKIAALESGQTITGVVDRVLGY